MANHVMILGCGRSGTSIFGELFDGLDAYTYESEPPFSEVLAADFSRPTAFKVPRDSEDHPASAGLSFPLDTYLARAMPATIFWIVRHPLDAICSLRVGIGQNWGHHPRPPDWSEWLERPLLERCTHHWEYLNRVGFASVEQHATVVHFEAMISEPLAFANKVCSEIGLVSAEVEQHLGRWARRVQDTNNADFVEATTSRTYSRTDHMHRVGRWRENLQVSEVEAIWPLVKETASRFGYGIGTIRS